MTTKKEVVAALRERWTEESARLVNKSLLKSGSAVSPFGEVDLLVDLRGLPLSVALKSETIAMAGPKPISLRDVPALRALDVSYGRFVGGGQFSSVEVEDCRFDEFESGSNWRRSFRRCSFVRADFRRAQMAGSFIDCDFTRADLSLSRAAHSTRFERCVFAGANLRSAIWTNVIFDHCDFAETRFGKGSLGGAKFIGVAPSVDQLADSIMDRVVFP